MWPIRADFYEKFLLQNALVFFFLIVNPHMAFKIALLRKYHVTPTAFVWSLARVIPHVTFKTTVYF